MYACGTGLCRKSLFRTAIYNNLHRSVLIGSFPTVDLRSKECINWFAVPFDGSLRLREDISRAAGVPQR